jgi:hypothetical protein
VQFQIKNPSTQEYKKLNVAGRCYSYDPSRKDTRTIFELKDNQQDIESLGWKHMTVMGNTMIAGSDRQIIFGVPMARTKGQTL